MNDPITWIILGIGFVVWLVSTIYKSAESMKNAPGAARPQRPRPATTEIDKFLEEINRRRAQQQAKPQEAILAEPFLEEPPKPAVLIPDKVVYERPKPVTQTLRPSASPPTRKPATETRESRRPKQRPTRARADSPMLARSFEPPIQMQYPASQGLMPEVRMTGEAAAPISAGRKVRIDSDSLTGELIGLLKSTHGIKAAFLVHEVLGAPRCKRRYQAHYGVKS